METRLRWQPSLGAWMTDYQTHFRVWAPQRQQIDVLLESSGPTPLAYPMKKDSEGVFSAVLQNVLAGELYRYRVDGGTAYPDPASRFQPSGVHGPSQIIDFHEFDWTDSAWRGVPLTHLVIYELHVGTFTPEGTFEAARRRLSYLADLGVTAIELMPVADFAGDRNWGYDGVAVFSPARCYGPPDDLRRLIDSAHQAGLAVLIDAVYNHLGPAGNYTDIFSPFYVNNRRASAWGKGLNFDGDQAAFVREFFIQNALHWVQEYHADGLRLDATHAIEDASPRHFLAELTARLQESVEDRIVHVIAEDNRNAASMIRPVTSGGMGLSAVWSDDFHHQVRRKLAGDHESYYADFPGRVEDLVQTVSQGWFYTGQKSRLNNAPRGTDPTGLPLERFVFCIQNHDQIGNRAQGERLNHQIHPAAYRAASALLLSLPETPLLFMGQEWAASTPFLYFTDHEDALGQAIRKGRRKEFESFSSFVGKEIPDPQSPDTFQKSKLQWNERKQAPHQSVNLFYRALLHLRNNELSGVSPAAPFVTAMLAESVLLLKRVSKSGQRVWAIINFEGSAQASLKGHLDPEATWDVLLTSEDSLYAPDPIPPVIELKGMSPLITFTRPGAVFLKEQNE